jgi:osmotically-inducible protein OsmY
MRLAMRRDHFKYVVRPAILGSARGHFRLAQRHRRLKGRIMSTHRSMAGSASPSRGFDAGNEGSGAADRAAEEAPKHGAIGHLSADEELQQAVCNALIETPELDTSDIAVRAANARVVLSGTVKSDAEQRLALRIAETHAGTGAVDGDELRVRGDLHARN